MPDYVDNKNTYLEAVKDFVEYIADLLSGKTPLNFEYEFGKKGAPTDYETRCGFKGLATTVEQLFDCYFWNGQYYKENADDLSAMQHALRDALEGNPVKIAAIQRAVDAVMDWGLPKPAADKNKEWARLHRHRLPFVLLSGVEELQAEQPNYLVFSPNQKFTIQPHGRVRMNAGYTKVYSLASDGIVIYDSRVGAALCWLVGRFLASIHHAGPVPDELSFLWSTGRAP